MGLQLKNHCFHELFLGTKVEKSALYEAFRDENQL